MTTLDNCSGHVITVVHTCDTLGANRVTLKSGDQLEIPPYSDLVIHIIDVAAQDAPAVEQ